MISTRPKPKRVSFSASDQVISITSPDSSSESESEELRAVMKGLALEGVQEEADGKHNPKGSSPPRATLSVPPTPRLRPRELPADDTFQTGGRVAGSSHAPSSRPGTTDSTSSPSPRSPSNIPSSSRRTASDSTKPTNRPNSKSSTADDALTLILSTRLTSGDPYAWDITVDPRSRRTRLSRMLDEEGDLPAAFSAHSQGEYEGELRLWHKSIPYTLGIKPRNGAQYVTIRDVFESLYAFMRGRVSERDLSAEGKQRQAQITQAAISRSGSPKPEVRRIDWLLGYHTFCGLSLGKDGETIVLLTGPRNERA